MNNELPSSWTWQVGYAAHLRYPFPTATRIEKNFSQAFQDLFVITALAGKRGGTYLEVGANDPLIHNNTCLLHKTFGWNGVSIEFMPEHLSAWQKERPECQFIVHDALAIDYDKAISYWFGPTTQRIDYLQLDIDPSSNTLEVLKRLPLHRVRFSVITFETDAYSGDLTAREESRKILASHGYRLVGPDISVLYSFVSDSPIPFEDWWIDPLALPMNSYQYLAINGAQPLTPHHLLFAA